MAEDIQVEERYADGEADSDARRVLAWSDFFAHVLIDPIEVPGTETVETLAAECRELLDILETPDAPGTPELSAWCDRIERLSAQGAEGLPLLAEEQRALAAERTRLCRGTDPAGPPPPYEAYWRSSSSDGAPPTSVSAAYRAAGARFDAAVERDDYLGTELAFLAYLATGECAAHSEGDDAWAAEARAVRASFSAEHAGAWAGAFCAAALPHCRTSFFKGAFALLHSLLDDGEAR